jgi:NitT/TauT family transport system permease protein
LAWSEKFKGGNVENDNPPQSWFLNALSGSILAAALYNTTLGPLLTWLDRRFGRAVQSNLPALPRKASRARRLVGGLLRLVLIGAVLAALAYLVASAADMLLRLPLNAYAEMLGGLLATALRVAAALLIAVAWTVPLGVLIGTRPRLAAVLQPIIQVVAAIPATAFFPLLVLALVATPLGLNGAAVLLMLLGTQWYLLFNVIAGASAMPADLINITDVLRIGGLLRLRVLILPSLFPYIVTGMITASGGAWNASIVAEYTRLSGQTYSVPGLGATISAAAASADYGRLLASTLLMIFTVVGLNRLVWRRLYRLAGERYRMDG